MAISCAPITPGCSSHVPVRAPMSSWKKSAWATEHNTSPSQIRATCTEVTICGTSASNSRARPEPACRRSSHRRAPTVPSTGGSASDGVLWLPAEGEVRTVTLCNHLWSVVDVSPSKVGCDECLQAGMHWVNLRICMTCGNVGCCNDSLGKHASAHWLLNPGHPIIRSFEPGEDWWWCFSDGLLFEVKGAPPAPSHGNTYGPWRGWLPPGRGSIVRKAFQAGGASARTSTGSSTTSAMVRVARWPSGRFVGSATHGRSKDGWSRAAFTLPRRSVGGRT
jgi:Zn-finger in ubiquitin-hydrolases and other protein